MKDHRQRTDHHSRRRTAKSGHPGQGISATDTRGKVPKGTRSEGQRFKREKKAPFEPRISVTGLTDQNGDPHWLAITRGDVRCIVSVGAASGSATELARAALKGGLTLADPASRAAVHRQIDEIKDWSQTVHIVRQPGLHCEAFIKPDGFVVGQPAADNLHVILDRLVPLRRAGTFEGWRDIVIHYAQGQSVVTLALCMAFLGPVLGIMHEWDNAQIELVSGTSAGKTTVLSLASTVWGAPHGEPGSISKSFLTTDNGLEKNVQARSGAFCPLNEVNLLGSERTQGEILVRIAFMLEEGVAKDRYDDEASSPRARICMLSTSNRYFATLMTGASQDRIEAAAVRLASVPADAGHGLGCFDSLPSGYTDSGAAIHDLRRALLVHHGHAIDRFLERLVRDHGHNTGRLQGRLRTLEERFLSECGAGTVGGAVGRKARIFARVYAAGQLAVWYGALPIRGVRDAILTCYQRSLAVETEIQPEAPRTAIERVQDYVRANEARIIDLDQRRPRARSTEELDAHPGFLKTYMGSRCLLIRTARWRTAFGPSATGMLEELHAQGQLIARDGLQTQVRVRSNEAKDRVYAIRFG